MSHLTAIVAAILLFTTSNRPGFENSNYIIEATGKVTLTKQGQGGWWSVVGADEQGNILLDPSINWGEGFFKVQIAKNAAIRYIKPTKIGGPSDNTPLWRGHLLVEASGIVTVQVDSWPPAVASKKIDSIQNTLAYQMAQAALIIKTLDPHVRSGNVKIKKAKFYYDVESNKYIRRHKRGWEKNAD